MNTDFKNIFLRRIALGLMAAVLPVVVQAAATINLSYTPATIDPGDATSLNIFISNSATNPLSAVAATVVLPSGITLNANAPSFSDCGFTGGSVVSGASTLVLTGGGWSPLRQRMARVPM